MVMQMTWDSGAAGEEPCVFREGFSPKRQRERRASLPDPPLARPVLETEANSPGHRHESPQVRILHQSKVIV